MEFILYNTIIRDYYNTVKMSFYVSYRFLKKTVSITNEIKWPHFSRNGLANPVVKQTHNTPNFYKIRIYYMYFAAK